jgi:hypothetical protein
MTINGVVTLQMLEAKAFACTSSRASVSPEWMTLTPKRGVCATGFSQEVMF